jgi:hypothetical protein
VPPIQHNVAATSGSAATQSADVILNHLTTRQYLQPHAQVQDVLSQTVELFNCCPDAIARGIEWLSLDPSTPIGRLRRTELVQLSKAVHRFWMQNKSKQDEVVG